MGIGINAAKVKLQADIYKALYDGFKSTYILGAGNDGDLIATNFAKTAAQPITDAIFNFISQAQIVGTVNGIVVGASPMGPVSGTNTDIFTGSELSII